MTKQLQPLIPFSRLSVLTMISFVRHMLLSLIKSHLFIFAPGFFFLFFAKETDPKKYCYNICRKVFCLCLLGFRTSQNLCLSTRGWSQFLGLVPDDWHAWLCSGLPGLLSDHWWVGPVPDSPSCRVWGILKLGLACWWMNLGPVSPRAGVGLLEDEAGPGYSRLAGGKVRSSGDSESGACPLVYGSWSSGLWLQCHVAITMPAHWCLGPDSWPSSGQGHVQGWLWAQKVLKQPICWWVVLHPQPVNCLAPDIPLMVPIGWWQRQSWGLRLMSLRVDFKMVLAFQMHQVHSKMVAASVW